MNRVLGQCFQCGWDCSPRTNICIDCLDKRANMNHRTMQQLYYSEITLNRIMKQAPGMPEKFFHRIAA